MSASADAGPALGPAPAPALEIGGSPLGPSCMLSKRNGSIVFHGRHLMPYGKTL